MEDADGALVAVAVAVVGRAEDGDDGVGVGQRVAALHALVAAHDEEQPVLLQEALRHVGPEGAAVATWVARAADGLLQRGVLRK